MKALRRFLITEGKIGEVPLWYRVIRAAKYLGVPPWDLISRSVYWLQAAEAAASAEAAAEQHQRRRQRQKR